MKFYDLKPGMVVQINHYDHERWLDFHAFDNQPSDFPGSSEEYGKQLLDPILRKPVRIVGVSDVLRVKPVESGPVRELSQHWWSPTDKTAFTEVEVPSVKIPAGVEDIITKSEIKNGEKMVDFQGERGKHRYYTQATYEHLSPKKNPFTNKAILPEDITAYIAELDPTLPVQEAGRRRRKTRKSRKTRRGTRR